MVANEFIASMDLLEEENQELKTKNEEATMENDQLKTKNEEVTTENDQLKKELAKLSDGNPYACIIEIGKTLFLL